MAGVVKLSIIQRLPTADIQRRLSAPLGGGTDRHVIGAMRQGAGSVGDQSERQATMRANGSVKAWPKTKPFGNRPAPAKTLRMTGRYLAAWTGGNAGGLSQVGTDRVAIGVDTRVFPQAAVFQSNAATRIPITAKMRRFVAAKFGVNFRRSKTHVVVEPRPFAVNPTMLRRVRQILVTYVLTGKVVSA